MFPVEIVHLIIVTKTYYFNLDTINGIKNLRDLTVTKFSESKYSLYCFSVSFKKYYESEAIYVIHLKNSSTISTAVDFATALFSILNPVSLF